MSLTGREPDSWSGERCVICNASAAAACQNLLRPHEMPRGLLTVSAAPLLASRGGMPRRCWVYVLKSTVDGAHYYVGSTTDVRARIAAHNAGVCAHTRKHRPWQLHVRIEFPDEEHATAFERFLKSGSGRAFAKRHFD